ncbi:MAG: hypothetical protein P1U64_06985 [Alcanivoracaceae bacterium]|jgi:hypothetical protein|nr:hypothetical protein [Alcanivoracaceae bacterium]
MSQKSIDNRVYGRYRAINRMSPKDIREMYDIFCKYYGNTSLDTFLEDMSKKTGVIVIRRRSDRHIVGFSTVAVLDLHLRGRKVKGVFSGDTIIEKEYWGSRALVTTFFLVLVRVILANPLTPVFWLLISKGYKTYLLLANNFFRFYPHPEGAYSDYEALAAEYAEMLFPGSYDSERKVLDFGDGYQFLRDDVAEITEDMRRRYPKIAFFEERNPGWARGNELPCVGRAGFSDAFRYVFRLMRKRAQTRRKLATLPAPLTVPEASARGAQ